jgi:hypothetical protein
MPGVPSIPAPLKPACRADDGSSVALAVEELKVWASEAFDAVRHRKAGRGPVGGPSGTGATIDLGLATTIKRWLDLYCDAASPARTPERERALLSAADAASSPAEATGLYSLAFAGWCWREVETSGADGPSADRGFEAICALLRVRDLHPESRRAAFACGVALHKSETD